MISQCFNCNKKGKEFYGFTICKACRKALRLFSDNTLEKHIFKFTKPVYQKEINERLSILEKNFIKKKIKLLDIQKRL